MKVIGSATAITNDRHLQTNVKQDFCRYKWRTSNWKAKPMKYILPFELALSFLSTSAQTRTSNQIIVNYAGYNWNFHSTF